VILFDWVWVGLACYLALYLSLDIGINLIDRFELRGPIVL